MGSMLSKPSQPPPTHSTTSNPIQKNEQTYGREKESYLKRVEASIKATQSFDPNKYINSKDSILMALNTFERWATLVKDSQLHTMNEIEMGLRDKLKTSALNAQRKALPILRDAFGPVMREILWEHDISAKTFGDGFQTIEFVGGLFAANRNIKVFFESISLVLNKLRFKQVRFKWYKGASEYTYYTLSGPNDDELVVWLNEHYPQIIM